MTTPHGSRGGSVPPRPPAAGQPQQWFVLRPWVFDVTARGVLLRARRARPAAPGRGLGTRLRADPGPGSRPHAVPLIGPGPDFDPEYAMTTDPQPVIIATVPVLGRPPAPLLAIRHGRIPVRSRASATGTAEGGVTRHSP